LKGTVSGIGGKPNYNFYIYSRNNQGTGDNFYSCPLSFAQVNNTEFFPQSDGTLKDQNDVTYTNQGTGDLATVYIPASEITDKDIAGVTLLNTSGNVVNENYIEAIEAEELISRDDKFKDSLDADLPLFTAGTANEIPLADIAAGVNGLVEVKKTGDRITKINFDKS
jgi:hypothetical protein